MAIKDLNIEPKELVDELIKDALFLKEYNKPGTLSRPDYDKKLSTKVGNNFLKNLKLILSSEQGINELMLLMKHKNPYIKFLAARYLYPLFKNKTMSIMENYKNSLTDKIEIFEVQTLINGLKSNQPVFMNQFKKLYNTEDLKSLNRER